eukprot:5568304-Heterocapsa_arctica.AAC.1
MGQGEDQALPMVAMKERETNMVFAHMLQSKEASDHITSEITDSSSRATGSRRLRRSRTTSRPASTRSTR